MTFDQIRPLIVPAEYITIGVPAAFHALSSSDLVLTWVELHAKETMLYVTPARATEWDRRHDGWRAASLGAMRRADQGRVWTHEKRTENGSLAWVAMMHEDGLGSSRLLLARELERTFPSGYLVALPDRSCGMAICRTNADLDEVRRMVAAMHASATTPMIPDLREPSALSAAVY
jgi:hypothetical protein